ncbi:MAG TPA: ABC transporter ATP-binding protein [Casimicrobiaceae bacterium]|nr:ABC transporter ATP-binding protein [Casimicrobiaceae bacterium]
MLEAQGLTVGYGSSAVVRGASFIVRPGEIVALIGANGAGKSTLLKAVSGLLPVQSGEIRFAGQRIDRLPSSERVRLGLAQVPEGRQVFAGLSIEDNLALGAFVHRRADDAEITQRLADVYARYPVLRERRGTPAGNLSGGQQQMLAIARGLMSRPRLLMLDEPSLGLSPLLVIEIFRLIKGLRAEGLAILLSEQNARQSLAIADRGYVIESGRIAAEGSGRDLLDDPQISARYLGTGRSIDAGAPYPRASLAQRLARILDA